MAPTIARNIEELRPMFLARCARAYRALSVHSPDLMAAVVRESTRKLQKSPKDFSTRDLQRVVDSLFASGAMLGGVAMENELAERMRRYSDRFCGMYSRDTAASSDDVRALMEASKDLESSLTATPMLISTLHISVPSRGFMRRCLAGHRERQRGDPVHRAAGPVQHRGAQTAGLSVPEYQRDLHRAGLEGDGGPRRPVTP